MTYHPSLSEQIQSATLRMQNNTDLKKIKVYDLNAFFLEELNLEAFHYGKAAVFEGTRGVIVAEHEAVHLWEKNLTDKVEIKATDIPEGNHTYGMPNHVVTLSIEEIMQAPFEEMTMSDFFDRRGYNPRCEQNFSLLMDHLGEIGFEIGDYFREDNTPAPAPER